jgi:outer membrane receptor for Fe3+-dicitrate
MKFTTRIATAALLCVLCVAPAFAKVKGRTVTVGQDFAVGSTVVKAGTYRFNFDDQKNELSVIDRKTKEVIARSEARVETRTDGLLTMHLQLVDGGSSKTLASISFDGEKQSYVLSGSTAAR